jgi:hypothetical protein
VGSFSDLTTFQALKANYNYVSMTARTYLDVLRLLRARYNNFLSIGYHIKKNHFPIVAIEKDGRVRSFSSVQEIWFALGGFLYDNDKDILTINDIKFKGASKGDIVSIFINKDYEFLPLSGKTVIDIGANIADSSVYFVKRGAKRVYAVEPNRELYELANENICLNSMSDLIETVFAGCSSKSSNVSCPKFLSLEEVVEYYKIIPEFLKIDCEGCEYDIILNSSDRILQSFSHILVEYHYGYKKIQKKLENCGFQTKISGPTYRPQNMKPDSRTTRFSHNLTTVQTAGLAKPYIGYVYAVKNSL